MTHKDIAEGFREGFAYGDGFRSDVDASDVLSYFQSAYTPLIEEARREERERVLKIVRTTNLNRHPIEYAEDVEKKIRALPI